MDFVERLAESAKTLLIGVTGIAFITLTEMKDIVAVITGVVTVVCLIYTTFFKKKGRR